MAGSNKVAMMVVVWCLLAVLTIAAHRAKQNDVLRICFKNCYDECMQMKVFTPRECKRECHWDCSKVHESKTNCGVKHRRN